MKPIKHLLILFISVTFFTSCGNDDDGDTSFLLSEENLAGSYEFISLIGTTTTTGTIGGIPVTAEATAIGDTFQVEFIINDNNTFSIEGQLRITTTVTAAGQSETDAEILVIDDTGSYVLDADEQTIQLFSNTGDLIEGLFSITLFNENQVTLVQTSSSEDDEISVESEIELRLMRL